MTITKLKPKTEEVNRMELISEEELISRFDFDAEMVAKQVVDMALKLVNCPFDEPEISLTLCEDEEIRRINRENRDIDSATDVLSFPNLEYETPGVFELTQDENDYINPENGRVILGDIVINVNRVFSQSEDYNHSVKREFAFLVAHSMMHLCGFDHMEHEEAVIMEQKQNDVLEALGITRDI